MKRARDIERMVQDLRGPVDARTHDRIVGHLLDAFKRHQIQAAARQPHIGRTIMKNPMTKLALAAAIIAAVVLGLFEFISTDAGSGVVWADVPERVAQTTGHIRRIRETWEKLAPDGTEDRRYKVFHWSPQHGYRMDHYDGDGNRLLWQSYMSVATHQHVTIYYEDKMYTLHDYDTETQHWNVKEWVERYLSTGGKSLGRKVIDGREAEGFEVTKADATETNTIGDTDWLRLWVDMETGYPVLQEDVITTEHSRCHAIEDKQQWDVEFDPDEFVPHIPSDYTLKHDFRGN